MPSVEYSGAGEREGRVRHRVRQAVHINRISHQTPKRTWSCGMKKNEFRISEAPPGSVLLMGDVAVFSVEEGFVPATRLTIQRADGRRAARPGVDAEDLPRDHRQPDRAGRRPARTCCPKRVTCE